MFALSLWRKKGSTNTVTPKVVGKDETQAELIDAIQRKDALMANAKLISGNKRIQIFHSSTLIL
ncbi:hypothetical protein F2P58_11905 [Vibrio fortis]|uniref:Uncharacterized protein n=1 Tax=Vibrio fortis TaxID=212667 RepID=A0A5N3R111_9VIBR|nr:hypothetical protein [Vibrio fortis]KAB0288164.1 hypothetical protein F2P58_11905 [Vibrio fortis]